MWFEVKKGSITLWDEELFQYHILQVQTWKFLRQARIFFSQSLNQFNHSVNKSWYLIISIIKIISLWIYGTYSFVIDKTTIQNIPLMTWFPLSFPSLEMPLGSHLRWLVPSNFLEYYHYFFYPLSADQPALNGHNLYGKHQPEVFACLPLKHMLRVSIKTNVCSLF